MTDAYAHTFRIRLDAEGTSATTVEQHFEYMADCIQRAMDIPLHVVGQVIEMADNERLGAKASYVGTWYKGRLTLAPDIAAQGYDGDRHQVGAIESSIPAVFDDAGTPDAMDRLAAANPVK